MAKRHHYLLTEPTLVAAMSGYMLSLIEAKHEAIQWLRSQYHSTGYG